MVSMGKGLSMCWGDQKFDFLIGDLHDRHFDSRIFDDRDVILENAFLVFIFALTGHVFKLVPRDHIAIRILNARF